METSNIISIIAVSISLISLIASFLNHLSQRKHIKAQADLNKLLLEKEKKEVENSNKADVSANLISLGKNQDRIRIYNKGDIKAKNISIEIPEESNWDIFSDGVLPLEYLEAGQSIDIILILYGSSARKSKVIIHWEDERGKQENQKILTW